MPLENMKTMLKKAREKGVAVGAFNILDFNSMRAVVQAAEETRAPVIVQTSAKTVQFWGTHAIMAWYRQIAGTSAVPVVLHLDHCKDLALIQSCIDAGWTSVMIDASFKPFEENLSLTKTVMAMAGKKNVSVEAELGQIGGVEDDLKGENPHLVDPSQAEYFCKEIPLDCFAPAIGTAHGIYKGEPKIAFDRLERIAQTTDIPLALHGGTGLSDAIFKKCIALGCAKVNISTQLKYAFIDGFVTYHTEHARDYDPLKVIEAQFARIKKEVAEKITFFGSAGQAG